MKVLESGPRAISAEFVNGRLALTFEDGSIDILRGVIIMRATPVRNGVSTFNFTFPEGG